jgi:hypothetical protein
MQARHEANMKRVDKSLAKQEQQRKARKKAYDEETGSIDRQIKLLEAQGKSTVALEQLQLKRSLTNQRELIKEARLNLQILRATNMLGVNDEMIEETLTAIAEMKQGILNTENEIKVARINNAKETKKEIDKIEKTDSIDLTKDPKYIAEQQRLAELNKLELDAIEKSEKAIKDANALKLQQEQEFQSQMEEIDEDNFQKGLQKTMTEEEYQLELVRQKYFTLEELAKGNAEQLAIIETAKALEIGAITKTASEKELADARAVAEQKSAIQQQGLDTAMQGVALIKGVFEKSKGVQKAAVIAESAIGIAKMIISNKLANVAALATPQAIATSGVAAAPVIAMNNVSTGLGIAANIAATAKALKTLGGGSAPDGGGGLGGSGGGAGGVVAPNLNVVGDTGINQLATLQQQPVKAYVVSNDVTSAQQFDMKVQQTAQI